VPNSIKKKYNIEDKVILLGVSTTWQKGKGLFDFISLSKILTSKFQIVLVGLSSQQLSNLPKNILGIERTENISELNELYSAADIVLNLSYQESFGMTTVEGYASGTPSIVYNCTASPELITPETGLIIEAGNIEALVNAIEQITKNGKSYYSSNCRKLAESKFDKNKKYDEYFKLYESLLNNSPIH
jgi:glycosyltransferase involved in cell wall biosynthesis